MSEDLIIRREPIPYTYDPFTRTGQHDGGVGNPHGPAWQDRTPEGTLKGIRRQTLKWLAVLSEAVAFGDKRRASAIVLKFRHWLMDATAIKPDEAPSYGTVPVRLSSEEDKRAKQQHEAEVRRMPSHTLYNPQTGKPLGGWMGNSRRNPWGDAHEPKTSDYWRDGGERPNRWED